MRKIPGVLLVNRGDGQLLRIFTRHIIAYEPNVEPGWTTVWTTGQPHLVKISSEELDKLLGRP